MGYPTIFLQIYVGGLILLRPDHGKPLQFAATASFLSKLYSDYLDLLRQSGGSCGGYNYTLEMLQSFSMSQASIKYHHKDCAWLPTYALNGPFLI